MGVGAIKLLGAVGQESDDGIGGEEGSLRGLQDGEGVSSGSFGDGGLLVEGDFSNLSLSKGSDSLDLKEPLFAEGGG